jgi:pyruvate dehydrogenase E2 component (dihydrolipoamide acetyltransferase)
VATEIRMPQWGMAMKEGAVVRWMKTEGEPVAADEPLLEIESAKAVGEVCAPVSGVLVSIVAQAGVTVPVSDLLAVIAAPGEGPASNGRAESGAASAAGRGPAKVLPAARKLARELGVDVESLPPTGAGGRITVEDVQRAAGAASRGPAATETAVTAVTAGPAAASGPAPDVPATPVARALARELGVDLATVTGTGPAGRVVKDDVQAAARRVLEAGARVPDSPPPATATVVPGQRIPVQGVRRVIAERMAASLRDSAQLSMGRHVRMDAAVALRERLVAAWAEDGIRPTYTDLVVAAVARALREHPMLNSSLRGEPGHAEIVVADAVHVGLAVATDHGLLVPVIRDAGGMGLRQVAARSAELAAAARARALTMDDLSGSTFTVSALGATGVEWFTPILNPPEAGILGVGAITEEMLPGDGGPVPGRRMTLSLTIDHRVVDGAPAGAFLASVAQLLENPYRLL